MRRPCAGCGSETTNEAGWCEACTDAGLAPALGAAGDPGLAPTLAAPWRLPAGDDLAAAIAAAPPGAELALGPGDHSLDAPLHLTGSLRLTGAGRGRTRVLGALAAHLPAGATLGLADLTLLTPAGLDGLVVTAGRVVLRDCALRGSAGGRDGLRLAGEARAAAEGLEVIGFHGCGVRVEARAEVRLERCELADNGGFGLLTLGLTEAEGLAARRNGRGGIAAAPGGRLRLAGGTVEANGRRGVTLRSASGCELRGVAIMSNTGPGIEALGPGRVLLEGNRCHGNRGGGILLGEASRAEVRANTCEENGADGIGVLRGATARLTANTLRRNRRYGLWIGAGAEALLAENVAEANREGEVMASWRAVVAHVEQGGAAHDGAGQGGAALPRRGEPAGPPVRFAPVDRRAKIASMRDREPTPRPWPPSAP